MTKSSYVCRQCKKKFNSEEEVKRHLQWIHNIPLIERFEHFKIIEGFLGKDFLDENREDV